MTHYFPQPYFKVLDKIINSTNDKPAEIFEYSAKFGGPNQQGLFKLKAGFDFSRLWFRRSKKASPQYVPLSEFFDSVDPQGSEDELTTLGRVIVPIVWLWEIADVVATLVKPKIPFDLTILGNDILPNLDDPEDAKDFHPEKRVQTTRVVALINGLLSYIDDHGRDYFVMRSTEETVVKESKRTKYTLPHPRCEILLKSEWLRTPAGLRPRIPRFLVEGKATLGKMPRDVYTARVIANYSPRLNPLHGGVDEDAIKSAIYICCHPVPHTRPMQCDGSKLQGFAPKHVTRLHRRASLADGAMDEADESEAETEAGDTSVLEESGGGMFACCKKPKMDAVMDDAAGGAGGAGAGAGGKTPEQIQAEEEALYDAAMAENEFKVVDDHVGHDHAITLTMTLADVTPELFTDNVQVRPI